MVTKKIMYNGLLTLMIILASGTAIYLQDAGTKTSCLKGWVQINESTWSCGTRTEMCYNVTNSANTPNYWCERGINVKENQPTSSHINNDVVCDSVGCI